MTAMKTCFYWECLDPKSTQEVRAFHTEDNSDFISPKTDRPFPVKFGNRFTLIFASRTALQLSRFHPSPSPEAWALLLGWGLEKFHWNSIMSYASRWGKWKSRRLCGRLGGKCSLFKSYRNSYWTSYNPKFLASELTSSSVIFCLIFRSLVIICWFSPSSTLPHGWSEDYHKSFQFI